VSAEKRTSTDKLSLRAREDLHYIAGVLERKMVHHEPRLYTEDEHPACSTLDSFGSGAHVLRKKETKENKNKSIESKKRMARDACAPSLSTISNASSSMRFRASTASKMEDIPFFGGR
jgi:hypothetical protein